MVSAKKETVDGIKENTIKMYDNTIEEMKKMGANESEIEIVEKAKASAIAAYDQEPISDGNDYVVKHEVDYRLIPNFETNPIMANLFLLHFENIPEYLVKSIYVGENGLISICFMESEEFSAVKYFTDNKKFDKLEIEYLNAVGKTIRTDKVKKLKVKKIHYGALSYESNSPIETYITFKYGKYVPSAC